MVAPASDAAAVVDAAPPTELEGVPIAFALPGGNTSIEAVVPDADRIYVVALDVLAYPRAGGPPVKLFANSTDEATGAAVVTPANEKEVDRIAAGNPELARAADALKGATAYEFQKYYRAAVVHGGYLYLANDGTHARGYADRSIDRVPLAGGPVEVVAKGLPADVDAVSVDDTGVYLLTKKHSLLRLGLTGGAVTTLYVLPPPVLETHYSSARAGDAFFIGESALDKDFAHANATITRVTKSGKASRVVTKLPSSVGEMVADATSVYWLDGKHTGVYRIDHRGATRPALIAKGYGEDFHVDKTHLYRIVKDRAAKDRLVRSPLAGGPDEVLRELPYHTKIVAVDDGAVWLANESYVLRHSLR